MPSFRDCSVAQVTALRQRVESELKGRRSFEAGARRLVEVLFEEFSESVVLARVFATVRFGRLPEPDREFVRRLADSRGCAAELGDATTVISLLASRGKNEEWNDRRKSRSRRGIPLVSASFIKTVPMVARLMSDLGTGLEWLEKQKTQILVKSMGQMARVLYVGDAATALSGDGFPIVPAQEFVSAHGVKTVFGLGGSYLNRTFVAVLLFTTEAIPQEQVEKFMPLINAFKTATMEHVMNERFFESEA